MDSSIQRRLVFTCILPVMKSRYNRASVPVWFWWDNWVEACLSTVFFSLTFIHWMLKQKKTEATESTDANGDVPEATGFYTIQDPDYLNSRSKSLINRFRASQRWKSVRTVLLWNKNNTFTWSPSLLRVPMHWSLSEEPNFCFEGLRWGKSSEPETKQQFWRPPAPALSASRTVFIYVHKSMHTGFILSCNGQTLSVGFCRSIFSGKYFRANKLKSSCALWWLL